MLHFCDSSNSEIFNIFPICIPKEEMYLVGKGADASGYGPSDEKIILTRALGNENIEMVEPYIAFQKIRCPNRA